MTTQFEKLKRVVQERKPRLVVVDPAADVYAASEIDRNQVRQFVQRLADIARDNDCAVMLLAHPSLSGLTTGRGTSGSTGWSNSSRSRLYLEHDKDDPDRRILKVMKANYGAIGEEIPLRWQNGVFVLDQGPDTGAMALASRAADDVFLSVFVKMCAQGQRLSPNTGVAYAPKKISGHADAKGYTSRRMAEAMQRLLDAGVLKISSDGPPSRRRDTLELTASN
jgi:RecA-family ATPase